MRKNNKDINNKDKQKEFEKVLAKESPELLLKLKEHEIEPRFYPPIFSEPVKLVILLGIIDFIAALFLTIITKKSHFFISGSLGIGLLIPWWLAFLDGFIFIGYGVYVIKRRRGELDIGSYRGGTKVHEIKGEAAPLLGLVYIFLGILLIGAAVIRCFIQGIF